MFYAKQISDLKVQAQGLEGRLHALTGQLNAANGNVEALNQEKAKLEARIGELEAGQTDAVPKAAHDEAIKLKDGEIAKLTEQLSAAQKSVDQKVVEGIANAGVPAARRDPKAVDNPAKPAAGNGQTPRQRLAALTKVAGESAK